MVCGNGGSAADSEHIVGELMKGFILKRPVNTVQADSLRSAWGSDADLYISKLQQGLPGISLVSQSAISSAFLNDVDPELTYAQLVFGYAKAGDVVIGLTTSGNSKNVVHAVKVGKAFGVKSIALTGEAGGTVSRFADVSIKAPAKMTYKVQEYHLPIYHALCAMVESEFFEK
jgi:D-sedoheptulose 7-phosphate isomerase